MACPSSTGLPQPSRQVVNTVQALNTVLGEALPSNAFASKASRRRSQSAGVISTHSLSSTGRMCVRYGPSFESKPSASRCAK